uniref:Uncharacterized protein n=1 Tax=Anguilla anguilla TaxID=7936 RepID=A0A0E9TQ16_ANGAN
MVAFRFSPGCKTVCSSYGASTSRTKVRGVWRVFSTDSWRIKPMTVVNETQSGRFFFFSIIIF